MMKNNSKNTKQVTNKPDTKLVTLKSLIKHIPENANITVIWKNRRMIPEGSTLHDLKLNKYLHDMEIVSFKQDIIEEFIYVDIEVM